MKQITLVALVLMSCVGQDILMDTVKPEVRIINPISTMKVSTSYQFKHMFLDDAGMTTKPSTVTWKTSDASKLTVDNTGLSQAHSVGEVTLSVFANTKDLKADTSIKFEITNDVTQVIKTERTGKIATTSSYDLEGDFVISKEGSNLIVSFNSSYNADSGLPGLYAYLTNNPNAPTGGYEIGAVTIFKGAHKYTIPNVDLTDYNYLFYYCKPFGVKVGHGKIK